MPRIGCTATGSSPASGSSDDDPVSNRPATGRPLPRLHVVTDDSVLRRAGWESHAVEVLEAGGPQVAVHVRGPRTDGATVFGLARRLLPHARRTGGSVFVNDRVDVGLVLPVNGVHLGRRSLPLPVARRLLEGRGVWLGASARDADGAAMLRAEGADYVFLGTIFETPTHPDASGLGLAGLARALRSVGSMPIVGIGGIDPAKAPEVRRAGAYGVAVVRGVWEAPDKAAAVRRYLMALENGRDAA